MSTHSNKTKKIYLDIYNRHKDILDKYIDKEPKLLYKALSKLTYTKGNSTEQFNYSESSLLNMFNALIFHLENNNYDGNIINKFKKFVTDKRISFQKEKEDKLIDDEFEPDSNIKTLEEYKKMLDDYAALPIKKNQISTKDKVTDSKLFNYKFWVIGNLYITNDQTRRVQDFVKMKLANKISDSLDASFNYFVVSNNTFIFNVYKTAGKYGQDKVKINKTLANILKNYIVRMKIGNGELLFSNELFFNRAIHAVFDTTINSLRKARVNFNNKNMTKKSIIKSSRDMQHSVGVEIAHYLSK